MFKKFSDEINSILKKDPAAKSKLEIILCYPGLHALFFYRFSNFFWKKNFRLIARFISQIGRFFTGIEIHPAATIGDRVFIDHGMGVVIGETAVVGNDVTIYHGVTLGSSAAQEGIRHPNIGNDVVIGAGAKILGPIFVRNGSKIGANAVVTKNVDEGQTVIGIPAKSIFRPHLKSSIDVYFVPKPNAHTVFSSSSELFFEQRKNRSQII